MMTLNPSTTPDVFEYGAAAENELCISEVTISAPPVPLLSLAPAPVKPNVPLRLKMH